MSERIQDVLVSVPPVSAIADVLALWGRDGWLTPPLRPIVPATRAVMGSVRIVDVRAGSTGPGMHPIYDVLSQSLDGGFVVIAGAAPLPGAMWGEILSLAAQRRGATGVLVDGAVRDRPEMSALGLPVYATHEAVVGPAGVAQVVGVDVDVVIGGTTIHPDDRIVADGTGCVRVRAGDVADVIEAAGRYAAAEELVVEALLAGTPLADAYHHKQSVVTELRR